MPRNAIALFTEDELRAALMLTGTEESASAVAAELYALPDEEQARYNWIDTTLMLLSCVSDDLAERVMVNFGDSPQSRTRHASDQQRGRELIQARAGHPPTTFELADVVYDTRQDSAFMQSFRRETPTDSRDFIALFSGAELRAALSQIVDQARAEAIAAEVFALPEESRAQIDWTDLALWLLSSVSDELAERVRFSLGNTAERAEAIHEMQGLFREFIDSGELREYGAHLGLESVVRPRN
jgi:hypothetical protein